MISKPKRSNRVSRVHEKRVRYEVMYPAIRLGGKWLLRHCQIGDEYTVTEVANQIILTFNHNHNVSNS